MIIGPGSFYTSLMPIFWSTACATCCRLSRARWSLIANLLTEGSGMNGFTASEGARQIADAIGRPVDVLIQNVAGPSDEVLALRAAEHKRPLALGALPGYM